MLFASQNLLKLGLRNIHRLKAWFAFNEDERFRLIICIGKDLTTFREFDIVTL